MRSLMKRSSKTAKVSVDHTPHTGTPSIIAYHFEVLTLILILLPLKTLLVLKSVSKHWLCVISHPQFIHKYFLRNPSLSVKGLFFRESVSYCSSETEDGYIADEKKTTEYDYIFLDGNISSYIPFKTLIPDTEESGVEIVQSCNGLLLCCNFVLDKNFYYTYYVFNPCTKQYRLIPSSLLKKPRFGYVLCLSLAFDPFKSPYYKIIAIWSDKPHGRRAYKIEIFSSETGSWRLLNEEYTFEGFSVPGVSAMYWNGKLNWNAGDGTVIYFDIDQEYMGVVPRPTGVGVYYVSNTGVREYQGHLYLIAYRDKERRCFDIFEMDTGHTGWALKCNIQPKASRGRAALNLAPPNHILFIGEEGTSLKLVFLAKNGNIISYDTEQLSLKKICGIQPPNPKNFFLSYPYIESLACV